MPEFIRKNKAEIIAVSIFIFFALGFNSYRVQGDGLWSYAFLERVLHIPNPESDPARMAEIKFYQCGNAFFNAPFYLFAYAIEALFHKHWDINGITLRSISINLASNFYLCLSLILCIRMLKKLQFKYIILPSLCVLFSTTAFSAAVVIPSFNHSVDIFINTLFVSILLGIMLGPEKSNFVKFFYLAAVYTAAILVRYTNAVLVFPLLAYFLFKKDYKRLKYLIIALIAVVWIVPLLIYACNQSISPHVTTGFTFSKLCKMALVPRNFLKYLIHPLHGLFIWSPVTMLSLWGLFKFPQEKRRLGYLFIGVWFLFLVVLAPLYAWHGGWSFSNRYLAGLFPIYIIGLSALLERYGKKMALLTAIAALYSVILFLNWHLCIMNPEFETPADMVRAWARGKSDTFLDKKVTLPVFLNRLYEFCRYKYIIKGLL